MNDRQKPSLAVAAALAPHHGAAAALAAAAAFAALTALGARLQIPLTPIPITGQVFCVLLAGMVLGPRLGFISQVQYLAAGAAGLPVFARGGGPAALIGPTAGYLLAFPLAALLVGACWRWLGGVGGWRAFVSCLAGVCAIYALGAAWYLAWLTLTGSPAAVAAALAQSILPFIIPDSAKAAAAAALGPALRRRLSLARP